MSDGGDVREIGVSLTVRDAARATGLSVKALRRRIERGTLNAVLVDGIRHIPMRALVDVGLLVRDPAAASVVRPAPPDAPVVTALLRRLAGLEARLAVVERELAARRGEDRDADPPWPAVMLR